MAGTRTDEVQTVTKGSHMLTTTSMSKTGKGRGRAHRRFIKPPDIVTYDMPSPQQIKQLTAVNDDILTGKKLGDVKEMWYTSPDGLKIQGWYITPPGFRRDQEVSDAAPHSRRPAQHVRRGLQLRMAGARGQRLRDPLHEPARQHRLRQRVRQPISTPIRARTTTT